MLVQSTDCTAVALGRLKTNTLETQGKVDEQGYLGGGGWKTLERSGTPPHKLEGVGGVEGGGGGGEVHNKAREAYSHRQPALTSCIMCFAVGISSLFG